MPKAAAKNCKHPGCPNRTHGAYCAEHERPDSRPSARERGYDANHEKWRKLILARDPLCKECEKHGRVTPSTVADHIIPLSKGGTNHMSNGQGLCNTCHNRKTASERGRAGQKSSSLGSQDRAGVLRPPCQK